MITYRKTKQGKWVAYGPVAEFKINGAPLRPRVVMVTKKSGERKEEKISEFGRPFTVDGTEMVYGYLAQRSTRPSSYSRGYNSRRACITDGNCSSFGSGRSCGGHDCDGY